MRFAIFLTLISNLLFAEAMDSMSVTYIANAGFLVSYHDKNILIDALFNGSFDESVVPSDSIKTKIINGEYPFNHIDLYLVTHNHKDHFEAQYVIDFLKKHKETSLLASKEVTNQLQGEAEIKGQLNSITLKLGYSIDTTVNGIHVKPIRLKHYLDQSGNYVANLAYLVNVDGAKFLHVGDYIIEFDSMALSTFNLAKENIDVMFKGYFDTSKTAQRNIKEVINPEYMVAMHMPLSNFKIDSTNFINKYPNGIVLKNEMDTRSIIPWVQYLYLGQTPPSDIPVIFAPQIITGYIHGKIAISPKGDEVYWVINPSTERIVYSRLENGIWTKPALADFVKDYLTVHNGGPVFSIDGEKLFFYSNRHGGIGGFDSWYVERTDSGWSSPINVGEPYNSINDDPSPLFIKQDKAFRLGLTDNNDPLCFRYSEEIFSEPAPVDIRPEYSPWWTIYISQEDDYLIFAGGTDNPDLFIRFKNKEGQWGTPVNMGNKINTNKWERFPFVSPDGKYLFFSRSISDTEVIFWVSTHIIDSIKATLTDIKKEDIFINKSFKLNQNFPNPFNPSTEISYSLQNSCNVKLKIYNLLGQEIKTLVNTNQKAGKYSATWDSTDDKNNPVSSGIYFYSLETDRDTLQKKMVLIK